MKATEFLKQQHQEVKKLFQQLQKADDSTRRQALLEEISENLEAHMRIEEEIFYPALREGSTTKKVQQEMVPEAYEEHHVVKLVLNDLPGIDPQDERFQAKVTVLQELVEHHVEEEETEMFKAAEKLGVSRLNELGEQLEQEMQAGTEDETGGEADDDDLEDADLEDDEDEDEDDLDDDDLDDEEDAEDTEEDDDDVTEDGDEEGDVATGGRSQPHASSRRR